MLSITFPHDLNNLEHASTGTVGTFKLGAGLCLKYHMREYSRRIKKCSYGGSQNGWLDGVGFVYITLVFCLATACGGGESKELLVFAATSLTDALTEIEVAYEEATGVDALISYGGSQSLARQIESGAPADVFISAGAGPLTLLEEANLATPSSTWSLLVNRLVVVGRPEARVPTSLSDLTRDEYPRIVLADPDLAPAGAYARESLSNQGIWDSIQDKVVFGADVRVTLTYVETGNADLALVYATDALTTLDLSLFDIVPEGSYTPVVYPVLAVSGSSNRETAMEFMRYGFETSQ
jgi:molybdate transport system substrate-binding protein